MDPRLLEEYRTLNTIIERDKAVTSFKYALLRGTIEICQQHAHLAEPGNGRIWYPLGLLIEKWILYYYPLFEHAQFIPQLNGERPRNQSAKKVLFRKELTEIAEWYRDKGGFSAFYMEYRRGMIPVDLEDTFRKLIQKVRVAIIDGPIQHLGYSQHGVLNSVFDWDHSRLSIPRGPVTPDRLVMHAGKFSIPADLASLFQYFGSFITGEGTLVSKWADFTVTAARAQGHSLSREQVLDLLTRTPDTGRQVQEASRFYHQLLADVGQIACVWSDQAITSHRNLHIDHVLPFSLWKNNDFWNLMPTHEKVNMNKKDMIPSPSLLERREDIIRHYWQLYYESYKETFSREIVSTLTGIPAKNEEDLMDTAFRNLVEKCSYLIDVRGYPAWNP
ncbi:MAG: HNH endonuclease domain-containing protein [Methanolinea sp.]|nr:HNH endonuclease domain-containing protein [Methanolinea sp.]